MREGLDEKSKANKTNDECVGTHPIGMLDFSSSVDGTGFRHHGSGG